MSRMLVGFASCLEFASDKLQTYNKAITELSRESNHRGLYNDKKLHILTPIQWVHGVRRRLRYEREAIRVRQAVNVARGLVQAFFIDHSLLDITVGMVVWGRRSI